MRIFVPLTIDEQNRLRVLAERERRRLQDQAALLIAKALADEETGDLKDKKALSATGQLVA